MRKRVLLADEDEGVRASLFQVLSMEGYEVLPAATGRQALAWILSGLPDLALIEPSLPVLDGWELLEHIHLRRLDLPVVMMTAQPHQHRRALSARVDASMEKPLDVPALLAAIAGLMNPARLSR